MVPGQREAIVCAPHCIAKDRIALGSSARTAILTPFGRGLLFLFLVASTLFSLFAGLFRTTPNQQVPPSPLSSAFVALPVSHAQPHAQPPATASEGKKWALLIGVAKYESAEVTPLKYPVADVNAMVTALEKLGFTKDRILAMTSDAPRNSGLYPTSKNVIAQLNSLVGLVKPEDTFVLFFVGHHYTLDFDRNQDGAPETNHYLATVNANPLTPTSLDASTLPLDTLDKVMRKMPATQVLYMLDAFHFDPVPGREDGNNPRTSAFSQQMKKVMDGTGVEGRKGATPARVSVYYANAEQARSWEDDEKKLGVFTSALVDSLSGKGANDKKQMALDTIATYVVQAITEDWNRKNPRRQQAPELLASATANAPILLSLYRPGDLVATDVGNVDTEARLLVKVSPPEAAEKAAVRVNGQLAEGGAYSLKLVESAEKEVEVAIIAPEYEPQIKKVTLIREKVATVDITLSPAAPAPPPVPTNGKDNAELVKIPAGEFMMGSNNDPFAESDEKPAHKVITNAYWIYRNKVTVEQYEQFCLESGYGMPEAPPHNPNWSKRNDPMVNVRWDDAVAYAKWAGGRLPTEAEWERAARGDKSLRFPWGDAFDSSKVWGSDKTQRAGTESILRTSFISESPFGVRDMAGNAWEWCSDWYLPTYYKSSPPRNPTGPNINGLYRVLRGGSYLDKSAKDFRSANRQQGGFRSRNPNWGFRVVLPVYATLRQQIQ